MGQARDVIETHAEDVALSESAEPATEFPWRC